MPKKKLIYPHELVAELAVALRAVPGATDIDDTGHLGGTLCALAMLIGASKEKDLIKAAERAASEAGIPEQLADKLVSVAYAFVVAMATVRDKSDTKKAAEA